MFPICHLETTGATPESRSPVTLAGDWPGGLHCAREEEGITDLSFLWEDGIQTACG